MNRSILLCFALTVLAGCAARPATQAPGSPLGQPSSSEPAPALRAPSAASMAPLAPPSPEFATAAKALDAALHELAGGKGLARGDGYVYGADVATVLLYAAQRGDAAPY